MNAQPDVLSHPNGQHPTILVIDDTKEMLTLIGTALHAHYHVRFAMGGMKGLEIAQGTPPPDLILLDVMMSDMDGYHVMQELQKNPQTQHIPVIFVTSLDADEDEAKGLSLGAVDYITKPIHPPILLARVRTHLSLKHSRDQLRNQNRQLEFRVQERTEALKQALDRAESAHGALRKTYFGMLRSFGELAELRGGGIGTHSQRVADLARQVALRCELSDKEVQDVFVAALLHDVGMIGFSDGLYHKAVCAMTGEDLVLYHQHPEIGAALIGRIDSMEPVAEIIRSHHEHYDGSGFPLGLSGLEIPLGSRIILAVSDYDSLCHGKMTAQAMSAKQSCEYLLDQSGRRYDPMVVELLEPLLASDENFEIDELHFQPLHLQQGMVLSRDVVHPDGFLLVSKNTVLNQRTINQLVDVAKRVGRSLEVFVYRKRTEV